MGEYVNSKQMRFDRSHASCSIMEAHHLPDKGEGDLVFSVANALYHKANGRPSAFVLFSDVVQKDGLSRGQLLAEGLQRVKAGSLFNSPVTINPRTGNRVKTWLLTIDHEAFRRWFTEEYANRIAEDQG